LDSGKTDSSARTVALPEFAITALVERRGRPFWGEHRMIFPTSAGTCRDPDNLDNQWRKVRGALGVPDVTSHSFRKSVATMIDDAGLSARIGHAQLPHSKECQGSTEVGVKHQPKHCQASPETEMSTISRGNTREMRPRQDSNLRPQD
jgi:hypothetical protein